MGLFTQYFVSSVFLFAVPPGDAYLFLISCKSSIFGLDYVRLKLDCHQCRLIHYLLSTLWFLLACSFYTPRPIGFGIGILLTELQRLSFPYFSCLTFFWWLFHSFPRLWGQGHMRNCLTGYVIFNSCSLQTLIDAVFFLQKVTPSWWLYGIVDWYHILVCMGYLASEKEWISSPARVGYSKWYLPIYIPPST